MPLRCVPMTPPMNDHHAKQMDQVMNNILAIVVAQKNAKNLMNQQKKKREFKWHNQED